MTRINSDLDPRTLADQHLMAEYRETAMVPATLRRSRQSFTDQEILAKIPKLYTLNRGHVHFFYDKLEFLAQRYQKLVDELLIRGYNLDKQRRVIVPGEFPDCYYGQWKSTSESDELVTERIVERLRQRPHWYRYYGEVVDSDEFIREQYGDRQ